MRIAFISYWSCPMEKVGILSAGGMNVYVLNLSNELGKLGHQVDIYTRVHKSEHEKILFINKNVRVIHLENNKENINHFSRSIFNFINKNSLKYDLIHSHYYLSGISGIYIKDKLNIPHLVTFHTLGLMKEKYLGQTDNERIDKEKKVIIKTDQVIASTEIERNDLITKYRVDQKKISVVSPGVNHDIFKKHSKSRSRKKLKLPQKKKIILFVGRIDPVKGLEFLIEAIYNLTVKFPGFMNNYRVLLIGGDIKSRKFWQNNEVKKIKNLIFKMDLDCCVKFLGNKPHYLLPFYYSASDVVVMPSVYESFGLVVLEAMASGSAILASKVGGLLYQIKDGYNGRLFKSGDWKSLGKIMMELLSDKKQREKLGKQAINSSGDFCWDKQAVKILNIYKNFL